MREFNQYASIFIIHSFLLFLASAEPSHIGSALLYNGDFELAQDDQVTGWEISNSEGWPLTDGYSGSGLHVISTSSEAPMVTTQYLSIHPETTYRLSFWATYIPLEESNTTDTSSHQLVATFGAEGHWNVDISPTSWESFAFETHGWGSNDNVTFTGYDTTGGGFGVDNVTLVEVSSSSSPNSTASPSPSGGPPASVDAEGIMNKVNVIWGVVGSVIAAIASVATIYMCYDRCMQKRRYGKLGQPPRSRTFC